MAAQIRLTQTDGFKIALNVAAIEVVMPGDASIQKKNKGTTLVGMNSGRNFFVTESYDFIADAVADVWDQEAGRQ